MKNAIGHGALHLRVGPGWVSDAETRRQQRAHRPVHPQTQLEALLRRHGPEDRHLMRVGRTFMISFGNSGHAAKVSDVGTMTKRREFAR